MGFDVELAQLSEECSASCMTNLYDQLNTWMDTHSSRLCITEHKDETYTVRASVCCQRGKCKYSLNIQ